MDQRLAEAVGVALGHVPESLRHLAPVDWFLGSDPILAGLHTLEANKRGVSYRTGVGHYVWPHSQRHRPCSARTPTIVLPSLSDRRMYEPRNNRRLLGWILHEFGHAVHDASERRYRMSWAVDQRWTRVAKPVTKYAQTNHYEAFAEAFADWLLPGYLHGLVHKDRATVAHFERLTLETQCLAGSGS